MLFCQVDRSGELASYLGRGAYYLGSLSPSISRFWLGAAPRCLSNETFHSTITPSAAVRFWASAPLSSVVVWMSSSAWSCGADISRVPSSTSLISPASTAIASQTQSGSSALVVVLAFALSGFGFSSFEALSLFPRGFHHSGASFSLPPPSSQQFSFLWPLQLQLKQLIGDLDLDSPLPFSSVENSASSLFELDRLYSSRMRPTRSSAVSDC
ncbi:hypothetical protein EV702DRAFT_1248984 [Suillus placidus]|uniref:Uncharacterized protein n=1 Tax=Suillus placidus TaxID=48579 RepID=A0A9P7CYH8_9AGAM|nr:hypothetical protein EV702DRAFT_1248984 [Suillus placidus]